MDKENVFGVLLTNLSKAFNFLSNELIMAILDFYGFILPALKLMHNYLVERKKMAKVNQVYSS